MENSYEALYTGVYIFVFVAALTIALYLFQGVNELADNAYDYGKTVDSSAVIETDTDVEDSKYLSREDVISYYFNYIKKDNYEDVDVSGMPTVTINGITTNNLSYSALVSSLSIDKDKKYELTIDSSGNFVINSVT